MTKNKIAWALTFGVLAALIAWEIFIYNARGAVDALISGGIAEAEREMIEIVEHLPETRRKVVIVREEVAREVLSLSGDALAARALERAERYRGRLVASADL